MTNHVHLLLEPSTHSGIGQIMKRLAGRQTCFRNRLENRRGTLWEGRYKSSVVDADDYLMACVRYIELNPVRAGMVNKPEQYQWSSYGVRLKGATCKLLGDLPVSSHEYISYMNISSTLDERELIRSSVQSNHVTGLSMFCEGIEKATGRRLQYRNPGRPKKCIP
jgi:putative transposase